jgi:transcriptional regulator with XRE-family HTH domain
MDLNVFSLLVEIKMTNIRQVFADNMKNRRKKLGLSQEKLAGKINSATNYIVSIEKCRQFPSTGMIEKIATALDVDTLDLFSQSPPRAHVIEEFCADVQTGIQTLVTEKLRELEEKLGE